MSASATTVEPADALHLLAAELREEGPVIAPHVVDPGVAPALGALVASGPRCSRAPGGYAIVIEAVREGYLLHYGEPRLLPGLDPDLRLLIGDYLYARGIEGLAGLGDDFAVAELSGLISLVAQIHVTPASPERTGAAAGGAWLAATVAIAAGGGESHERAKESLRGGGDARPLWDAALASAARAGISGALTEAVHAVGFSPSHLG